MFSPSVEISLETCKTTTETSRWHLKYQTFKWRNECGPCQDFCLFFPERHVRIALPLLTSCHWPGVTSSGSRNLPSSPPIHEYPLESFLSQLWKNTRSLAKNTQLSWTVQTEPTPGLAVNVTVNSTILMGLAHDQGTQSSLAGCCGIHLYLHLDHRLNTKPYYSLPTLDVSTKCTLGDWFLRNVTLDLW